MARSVIDLRLTMAEAARIEGVCVKLCTTAHRAHICDDHRVVAPGEACDAVVVRGPEYLLF